MSASSDNEAPERNDSAEIKKNISFDTLCSKMS